MKPLWNGTRDIRASCKMSTEARTEIALCNRTSHRSKIARMHSTALDFENNWRYRAYRL